MDQQLNAPTHKLASYVDNRFIVHRSLSNGEAAAALGAIRTFDKLDIDTQLFVLAQHNYFDLIQAFDGHKKAFLERGGLGRFDALQIRLDMNRRTLNFLASARSFLDQTEHLLSRRYGKESDQFRQFKDAQATEYDANSDYRLSYKLRDYAQHFGPPVETLRTSDEEHDDGTHEFVFVIELDRKALLESGFDWKSKVTEDLRTNTGELALTVLMATFMQSLRKIGAVFIAIEAPRALAALNTLLPLVSEAQKDGYPCILPIDFGHKEGQFSLEWLPMQSIHLMTEALARSSATPR